ncbi:hybrid sensor histidine kinase/response regulator [Leptolyngbya sp. 'hensonii']|uniref:hybrid sensor histidine kinase/response regulator n=1 Tax=Leptolyngbya sp. 'hensonii' TaxID=1922337 RepID=UPI00095003C3|nr:hybrid sensor histidine kinase/response regulator [Leptolyngbya sp. 'hensonii']OLP17398.1 hybrid sensor histidine kinase/response regulator [Leptolyngbya sp. 'hensonii']
MSRKATVLVVDDEPSSFAVVKTLLTPEGYDLAYVASGEAALLWLETAQPDVILLDVMMPGIDGIETCRCIRANPDWLHIPILVITALNSKDDLARCLEAGANDFLSKPVNRLELRARVRSMLRIKQQYEALKMSLQLRQDMANMVVHDLRNSIACVIIASEFLIERQVLQDKDLDRLQRLHAAGQKLNSMVNDLLILAKMESGALLLNRTEIDLHALASLVVAEFAEITGARRVSLEVSLPEPGHWISGDANLLHRLIENLLSNAVKFSPSGGMVILQIEYPSAGDNPNTPVGQALIQVKDQGKGVREELRQQIFNKFETGDIAKGTTQIGLGLTFCKLVAEAHGGRIYVEPNAPQGSIFTVEI